MSSCRSHSCNGSCAAIELRETIHSIRLPDVATVTGSNETPRGKALSPLILLCLVPALLLQAMISTASAKTVSHADVTYFTVGGRTPEEIYRNILDQGPRVNGVRALASINTRTTQDGGLHEEGGVCRVTDYVITLEFKIERPRISNEQILPPDERAMWHQMNDFIAAHENQHKAVWQACAADLDHRIETLSAPNWSELGQKAEALWQEMLDSCDKTQRSFDDAQSRALVKQPFMLRALKSAP